MKLYFLVHRFLGSGQVAETVKILCFPISAVLSGDDTVINVDSGRLCNVGSVLQGFERNF